MENTLQDTEIDNIGIDDITIQSSSKQPDGLSIDSSKNAAKAINVTRDQILKTINWAAAPKRSFITPRRLVIIGAIGFAAFLAYKVIKK